MNTTALNKYSTNLSDGYLGAIENSNYIEDAAATLSQLYDMNDNKIITIEFTDWAGFNIIQGA